MPDRNIINALKEKNNDGYKHGETPTYTQWYNADDMKAFEENVSRSLVSNLDAFHRALAGDYSKFELLSGAARIYIASKYMKEHHNSLYYDLTHEQPNAELFAGMLRVTNVDQKELFNPAFRLALAVKTDNDEINNALRELDDKYSKQIMENTLAPLSKNQYEKIYEEEKEKINESDEAIKNSKANDAAAVRAAENMEKQVALAKVLFLSHLGRVYTKEENREAEDVEEKEYTGDVTGLYSHCTRVCVVLPKGENAHLLEAISGVDKRGVSSAYKRCSATHAITSRTYKENSDEVERGFKEEKVFAKFLNQYGMDLPIGSLYNEGVPAPAPEQAQAQASAQAQAQAQAPAAEQQEQQVKIQGAAIKSDGSCGHMYMHLHKGAENESAAMLIGFESDSPSASDNQQGHEHSILATREKMSSFASQRISSVGSDYGGRMIDLSKVDPVKLMSVIETFEAAYRGLMMSAMESSNLEGRQGIDESNNVKTVKKNLEMVNSLLSGKVMTVGELIKMFDNGLNIKNNDLSDVLANTRTAENMSASRRYEAEMLRKVDTLPIIAPKNNSENFSKEDFKRASVNTVRRSRGLVPIERSTELRKRVEDSSVKKYEDALKDCREKLGYVENEPEDYNFLKNADRSVVRAGECYNAFGNMGFAIADELKEVAANIKAKSREITALRNLSNGRSDMLNEFPENLKRESKALAAASIQEQEIYRNRNIARYNTLNKVMKAVTGEDFLSLSSAEEAYITAVLKKKEIKYEDFVNKFRSADTANRLYSDRKILTFDKAPGINSLDDWKNADDKTLADAFETMFTPGDKENSNLNKVGFRDRFETLYINGVLMDDYYAQNPLGEGKNRRSDIMRKILNREAQIDVVRLNDDLKPVVATVTAESRFPAKMVTTGRVFKKTVTIDENKMYKEFCDNDVNAAARRKRIEERAMDVIPPERIVRMSKKNVAETLEQRSKENMRIAENEIRQQFQLFKDVVDPVEYQLYMLSQGMSMKNILDDDMEKDRKKALRQQWYSLKASDIESDKDKLNANLAKMKKTLAGAALHGGDLSDNDNIIGNLEQITWLNRAAGIFTSNPVLGRNMGSEDDDKTVNRIYNITNAQLGLVDYIKSDDYILDKPFKMSTHKEAMLNKLYLEGCNAEISGRLYSLVNDNQASKVYDSALKYNARQVDSYSPKITAWLEGKEGRSVHMSINKEGNEERVSLGFSSEPLDPKKVNVMGDRAKHIPEIKPLEKLHDDLAEGFNKKIGDGLSMLAGNIKDDAKHEAERISRLNPKEFVNVNALTEGKKIFDSHFNKLDESLQDIFNKLSDSIDQNKKMLKQRLRQRL